MTTQTSTVPTIPLIAKANYVITLPEHFAHVGDTITLKGRVVDVNGDLVTFIFIKQDKE